MCVFLNVYLYNILHICKGEKKGRTLKKLALLVLMMHEVNYRQEVIIRLTEIQDEQAAS